MPRVLLEKMTPRWQSEGMQGGLNEQPLCIAGIARNNCCMHI